MPRRASDHTDVDIIEFEVDMHEQDTEREPGIRSEGSKESTVSQTSSKRRPSLDGLQPKVHVVPVKKCCCGLVRYEVPSSVVKELQTIESRIDSRKRKEEIKLPPRWAWVEHIYVNIFFGILIVLNSVGIGVDLVTSDADGNSATFMVVIESMFLVAFWVELVLRLCCHGCRRFWMDWPWGPFDFGVTFLGSVDAWVLTPVMGGNPAMSGISALRTLRLLRLARLIRVFRAFSQLTRLLKTLLASFKSLTWVTMLLFIMLYTSTILVYCLLAGHEDDSEDLQRLTRGLGWTLFYHATLVTAEGHLDLFVWPTVQVTAVWYIYWVVLIVFLNFFMVNLMVGLIVQNTMVGSEEDDESRTNFVYEADAFKRTLLLLFTEKDVDEHGTISTDELVKLMGTPTMTHIMATFGINTDLPTHFLLTILGFQDDRYVSFKRFYESCCRVCGASGDVRSFMLQYDINILQKEVSNKIRRLGKQVGFKHADHNRKSQLSGRSSKLSGRGSQQAQFAPEQVLASPPPPEPYTSGAFSKPSAGPPSPKSAGSGKLSCNASLGEGFGDRFVTLAFKAKKKLSAMERRQEEMILSLCEMRVACYGASHFMVIRCPNGHPLMPLGTATEPVGSSAYRHWTCDAAGEKAGCRHGSSPGSHLTRLRRYHCKSCRYDLCEDCYNARLSKCGVGKLSSEPPPVVSRNNSCNASPIIRVRTEAGSEVTMSRVTEQDTWEAPDPEGGVLTGFPIARSSSTDTPPCEGN